MGRGFPPKVRELVEERAGGLCERCGHSDESTQLHHRRPRGMGSSKRTQTNSASNALLLCTPCHTDVESNREDGYRFGWLVRQGHIPLVMPVLRRAVWVLLDEHGDYRVVEGSDPFETDSATEPATDGAST